MSLLHKYLPQPIIDYIQILPEPVQKVLLSWQALAGLIFTARFFYNIFKPVPEDPRTPKSQFSTGKTMSGNSNSAQGLVNAAEGAAVESAASIMSPTKTDLLPPKTDPISKSELAKHDGTSNPSIWVAIKGDVFDVSAKKDMYGPGAGYHIFAGKDGSVGLGKTSLKIEDARSDWETLEPAEMKTLEGWYDFFSKRYNIVGRVSD